MHREYRVEQLDGFDYDIGLQEIAAEQVEGEAALMALMQRWRVTPLQLTYPWHGDYPE